MRGLPPRDPRVVVEAFDVFRDPGRPLAVALLPGLDPAFVRELRATFPRARLVDVPGPEEAVAAGFEALAVPLAGKDRVDEVLRHRPGIDDL